MPLRSALSVVIYDDRDDIGAYEIGLVVHNDDKLPRNVGDDFKLSSAPFVSDSNWQQTLTQSPKWR